MTDALGTLISDGESLFVLSEDMTLRKVDPEIDSGKHYRFMNDGIFKGCFRVTDDGKLEPIMIDLPTAYGSMRLPSFFTVTGTLPIIELHS